MTERPAPADETPAQKALRLKKAAASGRSAPGASRLPDERVAAARSMSKSKPAMKR